MPTFLILIPAASSLLLWLSRTRSPRGHWGLSILLATVLQLAVLASFWRIPQTIKISTWRPSAVFSSEIVLVLDRLGWAMAVAGAAIYLTVLLAGPSRPGLSSPGTRAFGMIYLSLVMASFLAGNLLTVIITWASADTVAFLYLLRQSETETAVRGLTTRFQVQAASVVAVLLAGSLSALEMAEARAAGVALLLSIAVLLRVGLWPLHNGLPALPGIRRGMGALVRLLPLGMGFVLLGRLLPSQIPVLAGILLLAMGGVSVLVGGLQWLTVHEAVADRPYLVLTGAGMGVTAAAIGASGTATVGVGITTILMAMLLSSLRVHAPWQRWFAVVASLVLVGVPIFPMHLIYAGMNGPLDWVELTGSAILSLGAIALGAGGFVLARSEPVPRQEAEPFIRRIYAVGLSLPVVAAIPVGVVFGALPSPRTVALAAATASGAWLVQDLRRRSSSSLMFEIPKDVGSRLEKATNLVARIATGVVEGLAAVVRLTARAMEGRAAMLWIYVLVLLFGLLFVGGD